MLILENDLLLVGVVSWYSSHLRVGRHLQLVSNITVKEFTLLFEHLLNRLANIVVELVDQGMLLSVFFHFLLDEAKCAIDNLLIQL